LFSLRPLGHANGRRASGTAAANWLVFSRPCEFSPVSMVCDSACLQIDHGVLRALDLGNCRITSRPRGNETTRPLSCCGILTGSLQTVSSGMPLRMFSLIFLGSLVLIALGHPGRAACMAGSVSHHLPCFPVSLPSIRTNQYIRDGRCTSWFSAIYRAGPSSSPGLARSVLHLGCASDPGESCPRSWLKERHCLCTLPRRRGKATPVGERRKCSNSNK